MEFLPSPSPKMEPSVPSQQKRTPKYTSLKLKLSMTLILGLFYSKFQNIPKPSLISTGQSMKKLSQQAMIEAYSFGE